jgi:polygalacturonase
MARGTRLGDERRHHRRDHRRCDFSGTDRGLRIKTRRGRGGEVARIRMTGVEMEGVATPLAINAFYFCDADGRSEAVQSRAPGAVGPGTPRIADITVEDVTARDATLAGAAVLGLPEAPVRGLTLAASRCRSGQAPARASP